MGFIRSVLNKVRFARTKNKPRELHRGLKLESLEDRSLLSAVPSTWSLASVEGQFDQSANPTVILTLDANPDQEVLIGIDIAAENGSSLKPGKITICSYDAETGTETDITSEAVYIDYEGKFEQESLVYASLSGGEYHITISPEDETAGNFTASVFLGGDTDASGQVNDDSYEILAARISAIQIHNRGVYSQPTIKLYQTRYGIDITQSADKIYSVFYDFNLDGILDAEDLAIFDLNRGVTVAADLTIQSIPVPEITPVPYTISQGLDSDDLTPVELDIPSAITVNCEETTVESFTVTDQSSMSPGLLLTTEDGSVYTTKEALIEYWDITESDYETFLNGISDASSISGNVWTFQNEDGLFDYLDSGDVLSMTFTYKINSFVYEGISYKTSKSGTFVLNVNGTGGRHADPEGPSLHTASFDVATGELIFNGASPTLNVLDGVTDPLGYEMSACLISVSPSDASYTVSDGAIAISSDGLVKIVPEVLAEDFESLQHGSSTDVIVAYRITDTHSGTLDGTITLTVTGGNHVPTGNTSHTALFTVSTGSVLFDDTSVSLNLLDEVIDPDGEALTAEMTGIVQPTGYTVSSGAVSISEDGTVTFNSEILQSDFADLPTSETVSFTINFIISDINGASADGEIVVTVTEGSEGPQGVTDHIAVVDLQSQSILYDGAQDSLNLLDGVTDPQGLALSVMLTNIDAGDYTLPTGAITQTDGAVSISIDDFTAVFKDLAVDQTSEVLVTFAVTDSADNTVTGELAVTVVGCNDAPYETETLTGYFDVSTGIIAFSSGETNPDVLYKVVDPDGDAMTASMVSVTPPAGYTVSSNTIQLVETEEAVYRLIVDTELLAEDFDLLPKGNTADVEISLLITDAHGATLVRTVLLTVTGAYAPPAEGSVNVSLVAAVEPTSDGVTVLRTGAAKFGTFYYMPADSVPETDYQSIAAADEYYLEVWVNDTNYLTTAESKFISSIQIQLNYDYTDSAIVQSVEIDDIYAGKYALDEYLYYDGASENYLKALQVAWVFSDELDWDSIAPITNGENAYLLARFKVTLTEPFASGFNTSITGVTDSESPFVDGWYYVRTGESTPVDSSEFITVNVEF